AGFIALCEQSGRLARKNATRVAGTIPERIRRSALGHRRPSHFGRWGWRLAGRRATLSLESPAQEGEGGDLRPLAQVCLEPARWNSPHQHSRGGLQLQRRRAGRVGGCGFYVEGS